MSKRSGFAVKITAFIEADHKDMTAMKEAASAIEQVGAVLRQGGFVIAKTDSRFMLSKDIPDEPVTAFPTDEPKAAQADTAIVVSADMPVAKVTNGPITDRHGNVIEPEPEQLPIPAQFDRRKA